MESRAMFTTLAEFRGQPDFGCSIDHDLDDWLIAPLAHNRDSDTITESNWATAVKWLEKADSEAGDFQIHSFNHWAVGWVENILIRPGSKCEEVMTEIAAKLEYYPVLDNEELSERESDEYQESWENWGGRDFLRELVKIVPDCPEAVDFLEDGKFPHGEHTRSLQDFYEESVNEPYYFDCGGCNLNIDAAVGSIMRDDLAAFIDEHGGPRVPENPMPSFECFEHEKCPKCDASSEPFNGVRDERDRHCPACRHQWWEFIEHRASWRPSCGQSGKTP